MKTWVSASLSKKVRLSAGESPEAALRLAERIKGDDRHARAADVLDRALRRWPENVLLLRNRAAVARTTKDFKQAESLLLKAGKIDGGEVPTLEGLGLLYMAWNRLDEAETLLLQARRKASRSASVLLALAALYQHLAKRLTRKVGHSGRRSRR